MRGRIISWAKSNKDPHSSHSVIIREFGSFVCKTLNIFLKGWGIKFDTSPPFISRECEEIFWSAPSLTALQGLIWRALLAFCRRVRGGWGISFDRRYQVWYLTPLSLVVNLNTVTHFVSKSITCVINSSLPAQSVQDLSRNDVCLYVLSTDTTSYFQKLQCHSAE